MAGEGHCGLDGKIGRHNPHVAIPDGRRVNCVDARRAATTMANLQSLLVGENIVDEESTMNGRLIDAGLLASRGHSQPFAFRPV